MYILHPHYIMSFGYCNVGQTLHNPVMGGIRIALQVVGLNTPVIIEFPRAQCPICNSRLVLRQNGGGRRQEGRLVDVASDFGKAKGIEVVKECTQCKLHYHHNYTEANDDDKTR